jgi:hypothetical protein
MSHKTMKLKLGGFVCNVIHVLSNAGNNGAQQLIEDISWTDVSDELVMTSGQK